MGCGASSQQRPQVAAPIEAQAVVVPRQQSQQQVQRARNDKRLVVAIDFGTACSGCAYAIGNSSTVNTVNQKAHAKRPTRLCVDMTNQTLVTMGDDAVLRAKESGNYAVFERFKMKLREEACGDAIVDGSFYVKSGEDTPRSLTVRELIVLVLQQLKVEVLEYVNRYDRTQQPREAGDVTWVLTVPISWSEMAKSVMEEAASLAGLSRDTTFDNTNVVIGMEPEGALLGYFLSDAAYDTEAEAAAAWGPLADPHRRFLVVDNGGGTYDICVVKVDQLEPFRCSEIVPGAGGPWGATNVDAELMAFLRQFMGADRFASWELDAKEKAEVLKSWEEYKTTFDGNVARPPFSCYFYSFIDDETFDVQTLCRDFYDDTWGDPRELTKENTQRVCLNVPASFVKRFFDTVLDYISDAVVQRLNVCQQHGHQVTNVVFAGGFSESKYLQKTLTALVQSHGIHTDVPHAPAMAVLRGAVKYGQRPDMIRARALRFTYGISVRQQINTIPPSQRPLYNDAVCDNGFFSQCFRKIATVGDVVDIDAPAIKVNLMVPSLRQGPHDAKGIIQLFYSERDHPVLASPNHGVFPVEGARMILDLPKQTVFEVGGYNATLHIKFGLTRVQLKLAKAYDSHTDTLTVDHS